MQVVVQWRAFVLTFYIVIQSKLGLIVRERLNHLRCLRLLRETLLTRTVVPSNVTTSSMLSLQTRQHV